MSQNLSKKNKFWFKIFTVIITLLICVILGEVLLPLIPIPGLKLIPYDYDELVGTKFYSNSILKFCNPRGKLIVKKVNRWGYLDFDHKRKKEKAIFRIGFFGDSFTEARQVTNRNAFFKQAELNLQDKNVESLAFGYSGLGTVQSYLICRDKMNFFNLDMVVYVFVENDIGDNIFKIKKEPIFPYAYLKNDSVVIDTSFRQRNEYRKSWFYSLYYFMNSRSILFFTIRERLKLLFDYGIKIKSSDEDRLMSTKYNRTKDCIYPNQNDLPSTWPDSLKKYALKLASSLILKWKNEVENDSKEFAILYVPRESEWQKKTSKQDTWKEWLKIFCNQNNINFIDPTEHYFSTKREGKEIYLDHFTEDGHKAFAKAFSEWFRKYNTTDTNL